MNNRAFTNLIIILAAVLSTVTITTICYHNPQKSSVTETEEPVTRAVSPFAQVTDETSESETQPETDAENEPETERDAPESETQPETTIEETITETVPAIEAAAPRILTYRVDIPLDAEVQDHIFAMCAERGIDPAVIFAMIYHESTYQADVIGDRGNSFGLMQIQPRWHQARMDKLGVTDLLDAVENVTVGIDYLDELIDYYGGDLTKALVAYNQGHYRGTVTAYATKVLNEAERIRNTHGT